MLSSSTKASGFQPTTVKTDKPINDKTEDFLQEATKRSTDQQPSTTSSRIEMSQLMTELMGEDHREHISSQEYSAMQRGFTVLNEVQLLRTTILNLESESRLKLVELQNLQSRLIDSQNQTSHAQQKLAELQDTLSNEIIAKANQMEVYRTLLTTKTTECLNVRSELLNLKNEVAAKNAAQPSTHAGRCWTATKALTLLGVGLGIFTGGLVSGLAAVNAVRQASTGKHQQCGNLVNSLAWLPYATQTSAINTCQRVLNPVDPDNTTMVSTLAKVSGQQWTTKSHVSSNDGVDVAVVTTKVATPPAWEKDKLPVVVMSTIENTLTVGGSNSNNDCLPKKTNGGQHGGVTVANSNDCHITKFERVGNSSAGQVTDVSATSNDKLFLLYDTLGNKNNDGKVPAGVIRKNINDLASLVNYKTQLSNFIKKYIREAYKAGVSFEHVAESLYYLQANFALGTEFAQHKLDQYVADICGRALQHHYAKAWSNTAAAAAGITATIFFGFAGLLFASHVKDHAATALGWLKNKINESSCPAKTQASFTAMIRRMRNNEATIEDVENLSTYEAVRNFEPVSDITSARALLNKNAIEDDIQNLEEDLQQKMSEIKPTWKPEEPTQTHCCKVPSLDWLSQCLRRNPQDLPPKPESVQLTDKKVESAESPVPSNPMSIEVSINDETGATGASSSELILSESIAEANSDKITQEQNTIIQFHTTPKEESSELQTTSNINFSVAS